MSADYGGAGQQTNDDDSMKTAMVPMARAGRKLSYTDEVAEHSG